MIIKFSNPMSKKHLRMLLILYLLVYLDIAPVQPNYTHRQVANLFGSINEYPFFIHMLVRLFSFFFIFVLTNVDISDILG